MTVFLRWLDLNPQSYCWLAGSVIITALALAVVPLLRDSPEETGQHDWGWGLILLAILAAGRWPTFLIPREFSPDESQLLAGAHTLMFDPVFWRSVDGATAGPFDFLALWPAGWLCGGETYLSARLTALALLAGSLTLAHQCVALLWGRRVARVAGLGAVCFEALTNSVDFLHYSTELVPVALLAGAAYAAIRRWVNQGGLLWSGLGGLLLGAVPLGKLQAAPLAAALGLSWLWAELRATGPDATRRRIYLVAGAVLPATLFACQLSVAGEWRHFIPSYLLFNLNYTSTGSASLLQILTGVLARSIEEDSLLHLWLPGCALWLGFMVRLKRIADPTRRKFILAGIAAGVIALGSILCAGRPFLHYWQLLVLPVSLLLGALTGNLLITSSAAGRKSNRWLVAACAICLTGTLLGHRLRKPSFYWGAFSYFQQHPQAELARHISLYARPGEAIAIWGIASHIYVETGLRQATRDAHFERAVVPGPYQEYFRERFLTDLLYSLPPVFLDATGSNGMYYHGSQFAHDRNYPELAAMVRRHYVLAEAVAGARIYRRLDLMAP